MIQAELNHTVQENPLMRQFALAVLISVVPTIAASGRYFKVQYPASKVAGELQMGVTYTVWIPDGVKNIRSVIVHQHGCGVGACTGGQTAAYDLHWQALAEKWGAALLGPSYDQKAKQNCRLWCDPRNGSAKTFLQGLSDLAKKSKHPELATAPWCLWGHSGGGFWASLMQTLYPKRIVAIWFRSSTAYGYWNAGTLKKPTMSEAMYEIPAMCNPGLKEKNHKRCKNAGNGTLAMFKAYRAKGAPIGFAPDPRTGHECGDSRYLAIPFFDACLELRLPKTGNTLRTVDMKSAWLAPVLGKKAFAVNNFDGKASESVWLPNEKVARAWEQYVKTGAVADTTPPPAPFNVKFRQLLSGYEIRWDAKADFESGIRCFEIYRNGKLVGKVPETPKGRFGRPLFQSMSYHDTPSKPLPSMRFVDRRVNPDPKISYKVIAVNGVGLKSKK